MKFYPASLKFIGENHEKYKDKIDVSKAGGCVELIENGLIKYYFPLQHASDFFLTPHPNPEWKDPNKYNCAID